MGNLVAHSISGVETVLALSKELLTGTVNRERVEYNEQIAYLTDLYDHLQKQESVLAKALFNNTHVQLGDWKALSTLFHSDGQYPQANLLLADGAIYTYLYENNDFLRSTTTNKGTSSYYNYTSILNVLLQQFQASNVGQELTYDLFIDWFNSLNGPINSKTNKAVKASSFDKFNLAQVIIKTATQKSKTKNKIQVKYQIVEQDVPLNEYNKARLRKIVEQNLDLFNNAYTQGNFASSGVYPLTDAGYKQYVNDIIASQAPDVYKTVIANGNFNSNAIMLNRSPASTKGYLGEIRGIYVLAKLFRGPAVNHLIATGALQDELHGGEIHMDAMYLFKKAIEPYGFQIKNYILENGDVYNVHSDSMQATNFLTNRLPNRGSVQDILTLLFATYQYNQPVKSMATNSHFRVSPDEYKEQYYDNVVHLVKEDLTEFLKVFIDNIMRLDWEIQVSKGTILSKKVYSNTLFLIGDKFIPGSYIVKAILDEFTRKKGETNVADDMIQFKFRVSEPTNNPTYKLNKIENIPVEDAAKQIKVKYEITMRLNKIIENALASLK